MALDHPTPEMHRPAAVEPSRATFIHGIAAHPNYWSALQKRMAFSGPMAAPSFPWGTHRENNPALEIDDALSVLLLDGLGTDDLGEDILVCHSFGALSTLVGICSGALTAPRVLILFSPFYRDDSDNFDWARMSYYVNDFHLVLEEAIRISMRQKSGISDDLVQEMALKVREWVGPVGWMHFFRAYLETPSLDLSRIDCPVLIIGGEKDISAFPEDAVALAGNLGDAELHVLQDAGHFPFITHVETCAGLVNDFLKRNLKNQPDGVDK